MTDAETRYGWNPDMGVPLLDKLKADLKKGLMEKNTDVKNTIRQIMAEFPKLTVPITLETGKKTTRIKKAEEITDDDVIDIIRGLIKSEKMVLELKKLETSPYLQILETYLPRTVGRDEISAWIDENIDLSQFRSPMQAMGSVMKHFGKRAEGALVKEVLQEKAQGK